MPTPVDWPTRDPVSHRVETTPDRVALVDAENDESWTFRELDSAIERRTATLASDQTPTPTVALLMDTRVEFVETIFATWRLGGRVVPLNVRLTERELAAQLDRITVDYLVCERTTHSTASAITDTPVHVVDGSGTGAGGPSHSSDDVPDQSASLSRDSDVLCLFTSGTTGQPKGVRLTLGNLVASATASAFRLGVSRDDRWLCCLPTYHMGGFAPIFRSALYGTTVVIQSGFDATRTATVIDETDVTGVSLVPTMLRRLLDAGWNCPAHLRFVLLGGAPASTDLRGDALDAGIPIYPTYGMTETASQIATARPTDVRSAEGTVGQPLVNTDVTIVDDDGTPLPDGDTGEIVVDGPTVTPGYLDDETTEAAFTEHGLTTGDVGYRASDGRVWVLNRKDDRIVSGGENVDPGEVSAVVRAHDAVRDVAVTGLPDEEWGERVAALVVTEADARLTVAEVQTHCRERLAGFKIPRTISFVESLPRTASGTVDRGAVRDYLDDAGSRSDSE